MSLNTPLRPKRLRKYHDSALGSDSRGQYSRDPTDVHVRHCNIPREERLGTKCEWERKFYCVSDLRTSFISRRMYPEKKTLMYCMISMLGTLLLAHGDNPSAHIMTACFFMPSIIVSMFFGSRGLGVSSSPPGLAWRYSPDERAAAVACEKAWYCTGCSGERGAADRRAWERMRARLGVSQSERENAAVPDSTAVARPVPGDSFVRSP